MIRRALIVTLVVAVSIPLLLTFVPTKPGPEMGSPNATPNATSMGGGATLASSLGLLAVGQQPKIDPTLPEDLRPVVERAVEAELDPKRGAGNAVEVLRLERKKHQDQRHQLALDLRNAATTLRQRFITVDEYPVPIRYEQALSTFSRLELTEPGIEAWIDKALQHHEYAKKRIGKKNQRVIEAVVLTRGGLDRKRIQKAFQETVATTGFRLKMVPAKKATMVLKVSAEDAPSQKKDLRMVRVQLGLESVRDGKVVWRHNMWREDGGKDADEAIDRALTWLAKVGGRDMFFRWLGETAFHSFLQAGPGPYRPNDGHAHGQMRGFAPKGEHDDSHLEAKE